MPTPELKYHQVTFNLLNITPEIDDAAVTALDELAQRIGCDVPAAVQEWYSLKNGSELIIGNQDHVQTLAELKLANLHEQRDNWADTWLYMPDDMLLIIVENQGVCLWTIQLNGSDDPPVYTRWNEDDGVWQLCADHFSDFIYYRVWDKLTWYSEAEYTLITTDHRLRVKQRDFLCEYFLEVPASRSRPDCLTYRFYNAMVAVRIDVNAVGQSDWCVTGSKIALHQFLRDFQAQMSPPFANVVRDLWREFDEMDS